MPYSRKVCFIMLVVFISVNCDDSSKTRVKRRIDCDAKLDYTVNQQDPTKYYRCINNVLTLLSCQPGFNFDPVSKICRAITLSNVNCLTPSPYTSPYSPNSATLDPTCRQYNVKPMANFDATRVIFFP
jgi:hypothetical protein